MIEETYKGYDICIEQDEGCGNPFKEWDFPETLAIRTVGINSIDPILEGDNEVGPEQLLKWLNEGDDVFLCSDQRCDGCEEYDCEKREELDSILHFDNTHHWLPIYKYEHGGVAYNTTGFTCPWDSGQVGYISISKGDFKKEFPENALPDRYLIQTVELLSDWANGNCYGFVIRHADDNEGEVQDSCWGYYGEAGKEAAIKEAKEYIDLYVANKS